MQFQEIFANGVEIKDISPDSKFIITSHHTITPAGEGLILWDIRTGREVFTVPTLEQYAEFTADGKYFVYGSNGRNLAFDLITGELTKVDYPFQQQHPFRGSDAYEKTSDGRYKLSLVNEKTGTPSYDNDIVIAIDVATGAVWKKYAGIKAGLLEVRISANQKFVVALGSNKTAYVWDFATAKLLQSIPTKGFLTFCLTPDGSYVIFQGNDAVVAGSTATGKIAKTYHHKDVVSYLLSADGKYLFTSSSNGELWMWDVHDDSKRLRAFEGKTSQLNIVGFSSSGKQMVCVDSEKMTVWDMSVVRPVTTIPIEKNTTIGSIDGRFPLIDREKATAEIIPFFSSDTLFAVEITKKKNISLINPVTNKRYSSFTTVNTDHFWSTVNADSVIFTEITPDKQTIVYDLRTGTTIRKIIPTPFQKKYPGIAISENSNLGFHTNNYADSRKPDVDVLDLTTGDKICTINLYKGDSFSNSAPWFSPDGLMICNVLFYNDEPKEGINQWDARTGAYKGAIGLKGKTFNMLFTDNKYYAIIRNENNKAIFIGYGTDMYMFDGQTGREIRRFRNAGDNVVPIALKFNGKQLVTYSSAGYLIWDVQTGTISGKANVADALQIRRPYLDYSIEYSFSGRYVIYRRDAVAEIYDRESGDKMVNLLRVGTTGEEYIAFTDDGYYQSSKKGVAGIHYVQGTKIISFDQFDLKFNRPDIIMKRLGLTDDAKVRGYNLAYQKRLKKAGLTEARLASDFHLPELEITSSIPLETGNYHLSIPVRASDSRQNLEKINVWINDVPAFGSGGLDIRSLTTSEYSKTIDITLSAGSNTVQVSTVNDQGTESIREQFTIFCKAAATKPALYVLAIGVSTYVDSSNNLNYAAKDASDFAAAMKGKTNLYSAVHTNIITNEQATRENIMKARVELMKSTVDDNVIVYVASHGLLDDSLNYYLATHDVDFSNPATHGLAYEELEGLLDGIPARKNLLLMDACNSGEVDKEETQLIADNTQQVTGVKARGFKKVVNKNQSSLGLQNSFELMRELFANLERGSGSVVISSASGKEYAFESSQWKNGVFTYSLLEGLKSNSADKNKDKQITVGEMKDYVTGKVRQLTQGKQTPTSRRESIEYDFRVW